MDVDYFTSLMARNAERIRVMVQGVPDQQARWKPDPASWSMMEVIAHLYDEEREDFRVRLDFILHRPDQPWPGIDPEGWVTERGYNQWDFEETLNGFLAARQDSIAWLKGLSQPNWDAVAEPPFAKLKAGDMFASWVAHDLLAMRQLVELHWAFTTSKLKPYRVGYAGDW
jgi:hypothetical protein